jgi:cyclopropane-fatty-acyl-phospholipid synthase
VAIVEPRSRSSGLATIVEELLGRDLPVSIDCYDGTTLGPPDATTRIVLRSPLALRHIVTAPGELGFGRAYVSGALDVEGDIFRALELRDQLPDLRIAPHIMYALARHALGHGFAWPHRPPEEAHLHGRRHSRERDSAAIAHHYDISNRFYELVLGPAMTYSCAVWSPHVRSLAEAQAAKYELICRKLALHPAMRLLDVGCGWGGMVMHAAREYGVRAVGVTLSEEQAEYAREAVKREHLDDRVEIRVQDYRDIDDGPYDAISSIGMFEHVGLARLDEYFTRLHGLLSSEGRLMNHGISRPPGQRARFARRGFIDRYVFPDSELHEIGTVVTHVQQAGFEVRHVESLREHYAKTLRAWVANLESNWDAAVNEVGAARARVWRLYMAASAINFETNRTQIHQLVAVRSDAPRSGLEYRPDWS